MSIKDKTALRLTPHQLATMLVMESLIQALQTGATQLGGFLKLEDEARDIMAAAEVLAKRLEERRRTWATGLVLAAASDVPSLVQR